MFLESIDKKPLFDKDDGNTVRDLTQSMFDFKSNNYTSFNVFKISVEYLMRPDLISQAVYNNTMYTEFVLKYNGISNPFSMEEGDIILIPNLEGAKNNTKSTSGTGAGVDIDPSQKLRDAYKYIDPSKIPKRDGNIANFDDRQFAASKSTQASTSQGGQQTNATLQNGALPPNIAAAGATQIVQRNGRVYFGEGIGESACLKNGMSSSEFLTQVIKSKSS
jgi:hypothetical protein